MAKELLYLSRKDVETVDLSMKEIIGAVETAFKEKGKGRTEMPPKPGIHPVKDSFIHAMPAYIGRLGAAGMKWVSGFPDNQKKGLPYISGVIVLNNPATGIPMSVMDASWVTAKRTGAATAVAAKLLAREDSRVMGMIGCGVQGRTNLEAIVASFQGVREVRAYDISRPVLERYVKEMSDEHGVKVVPVDSPRKAVEECDIVVTAGPILKHPSPVIEADWLKKGGFACPLDFDSYWKSEAMKAVDKFCTDDIGQLEYYKTVGYFSGIPQVHADLGELVSGKKKGRTSSDERTMSMNLGVAIEDMATAISIYEKAKKKGIGTWLDL